MVSIAKAASNAPENPFRNRKKTNQGHVYPIIPAHPKWAFKWVSWTVKGEPDMKNRTKAMMQYPELNMSPVTVTDMPELGRVYGNSEGMIQCRSDVLFKMDKLMQKYLREVKNEDAEQATHTITEDVNRSHGRLNGKTIIATNTEQDDTSFG